MKDRKTLEGFWFLPHSLYTVKLKDLDFNSVPRMECIYILSSCESVRNDSIKYIGMTTNLKQRIDSHRYCSFNGKIKICADIKFLSILKTISFERLDWLEETLIHRIRPPLNKNYYDYVFADSDRKGEALKQKRLMYNQK